MSNSEKTNAVYDARTLGMPQVLVLGVQHLFAMFGATVRDPANTTYGENTGVLALSRAYDPMVVLLS